METRSETGPIEYAKKIEVLLRETDRTTANAALKIARELFEYRSTQEAVSHAWDGWTQGPDQSPGVQQADSSRQPL